VFTLDLAIKLCKKATDNFAVNCKNPQHVALLNTLKYKIRINTRMRVAAGRARKILRGGVLTLIMDLNQRLLSKASEQEQFQDVSHELAHLLDYAIRGKSGHDEPWKNLHLLMGGDASRCHQYDVTGLQNKVKRFLLTDTKEKKEWMISGQRYKKLYHALVMYNLSEPGRYKTKRLTQEEIKAYRANKKA
jgi:predicted SprT family Zn-dependent metalloprotease